MAELANIDRELLRKALLRYLVYFHPGAFDDESMRRCVRERGYLDFLPDRRDVRSALDVLKDLGLVEIVQPSQSLGATEYWKATAKGVLDQERARE